VAGGPAADGGPGAGGPAADGGPGAHERYRRPPGARP
jgi:hypothetical protein